MIDSTIYQSFRDLQIALFAVELAWMKREEAIALAHAIGDARHHCCSAAAFLVDFERDAAWQPGEAYPLLTDVDRMVAHEAFHAVLTLEGILLAAARHQLPGHAEMELALTATGAVLDRLAPFTSAADRALRMSGPAGARTSRPTLGQFAATATRDRGSSAGLVAADGTTP